MPNFFIPFAKSKSQQENVLNSIIKFNREQLGVNIDSKRIYKLKYVHEGEKFVAQVGEPHKHNKEPVIAILHDKTRDLYLVCTTNRGVTGGIPILVGTNEVEKINFFKD